MSFDPCRERIKLGWIATAFFVAAALCFGIVIGSQLKNVI